MSSNDSTLSTSWRSTHLSLFKYVGWKWLCEHSKPRPLVRSMSVFCHLSGTSGRTTKRTCPRKSLPLQLGPQNKTNEVEPPQAICIIAAWSKPLSRTTCLWAWESMLMALSLGVIVIIHHYCGNSWLSSIVIHSSRLKVKENKKTFSEKFPSLYSYPSQQLHLPMGTYFY